MAIAHDGAIAVGRAHRETIPNGVADQATTVSTTTTVSVVLPAKNESRNIEWVLRRIPDTVDQIVLVDGLSHDETIAVAQMVKPDLCVVHEDRRGKGVALRSGFAAATGDVVVMLDADGSMDPQEIERFVEPLLRGYDLAKGSRFMRGGGSSDITAVRSMGNRLLLMATNVMFGTSYTDLCYGYVAFRRSALGRLNLTATGFDIEAELVAQATRAGLKVAEVPSFESPRRFGTSNLRAVRDGWKILRRLVAERYAPIAGAPEPRPEPALELTDLGQLVAPVVAAEPLPEPAELA
jgi:glycosyltransferase involved in cell wall biosynthesis